MRRTGGEIPKQGQRCQSQKNCVEVETKKSDIHRTIEETDGPHLVPIATESNGPQRQSRIELDSDRAAYLRIQVHFIYLDDPVGSGGGDEIGPGRSLDSVDPRYLLLGFQLRRPNAAECALL